MVRTTGRQQTRHVSVTERTATLKRFADAQWFIEVFRRDATPRRLFQPHRNKGVRLVHMQPSCLRRKTGQTRENSRTGTKSDVRAAYLGPPAVQRLRGVDRILNGEMRAVAVHCFNEGDGLARVAPACPPTNVDVGKVGRVNAELGRVHVCKVRCHSNVGGHPADETEKWRDLLR